MAVTRKPKLADQFIEGAKADSNVNTENSDNVKPETRDSVNKGKHETAKKEKKTKLTFYMTSEMYLKWKEYELEQLQKGKKVSFQGVVEQYLNKILGS